MSGIVTSLLQAGLLPDRSSVFTRKNILVIYLVAACLTSVLFYLVPPGYYDRNANLATAILTLALVPLAWHSRFFQHVVNATTLSTLVLVIYIAIQSGGVNSTAMVWLNLVCLPVLLLLGPRATLIWIGIVLTSILGVLLATRYGWVSGQVNITRQAVPWSWMNHAMATINLVLGVRLYDHLHQQQLQQLEQRNEEIKATHQELLQAQAHKDEFVAAVGHELRTPMNAILGFNSVLREELADQPHQVEVVDHIRRSTTQLLQVVNDILDFSQLQADKMLLFPVDFELAVVMDDALQTQRDKALEKGVTLTGHLDPALPARVHADRQRILQILRNLLDNALKFTDVGSVQLNLLRHGQQLRCEVSDTGRGISEQQQAHIFRQFEHADVQTTRAYGGTGLGLSISEKLVLLQGGQIGVSSQEGHGASFWFEIPLQVVEPSAEVARPAGQIFENEALRILVVDDNAMNLMVARLQLQKYWPQAEIVTADSAAKALVYLDESVFDVALVDMIMPDMDGVQLTQQILHQFPDRAARMPVIALTANTNPVDQQRCLNAGMCDVLGKPMDVTILVRCVSGHIQRARGLKA
jgi:signal transduction histidine kinase/CheY-like chemotaxis protein